ncbi:hypothetical protein EJB05_05000, partial [Eragrostis curvula]
NGFLSPVYWGGGIRNSLSYRIYIRLGPSPTELDDHHHSPSPTSPAAHRPRRHPRFICTSIDSPEVR